MARVGHGRCVRTSIAGIVLTERSCAVSETDLHMKAWRTWMEQAWPRIERYQAWKRTPRGRLAILLYPYSHRAYLWLARKDGWA
jgi:hypothetical protein